MSAALPQSEYKNLLTMSKDSVLWTWHVGLVEGRVLDQVASRLPGLVGKTLMDHQERPVAIFFARLLFELGVVSHQPGGIEVRPAFLDDKERVKIHFSVSSPWGVYEVSPDAVNEFLAVALVLGDGLPKDAAHTAPGARGYEVDRTLELLWDSDLEGRGVFKPEQEPEDLVFAFERDGELRLVNCGKPRFGKLDAGQLEAEGWHRITPPFPHAMFPASYVWKDPLGTSERRFYIPGTEAGCELRLYGGAFESGAEVRSALGAHFGDEGASIRVHFEYVPGWETVPVGRQSVYCWSGLAEYMRGKLIERNVRVVEI